MNPERTYVVPLAPREVLSRLSGAIDSEGLFTDAGWGGGSSSHYGRIDGSSFTIKVYSGAGSSFKRVLKGRVDPDPGGSIVRIQVAMNSHARIFMKIWLGMMVVFQILILLIGLSPAEKDFKGWVLLAPAGMMLAGIVFFGAGKAISRVEEDRLIAFADQLWGPPLQEGRAVGS